MENELKSLARERIWFLEQVRRKAEKSVTISNGGNFICRKVRGAFQYYLNGGYVKKSEKDKLRMLAKDRSAIRQACFLLPKIRIVQPA